VLLRRHRLAAELTQDALAERAELSARGIAARPVYRNKRHDLPAHLPALIGRDEVLKIIPERLLVAKAGLITLTGAGWSGKTRLALAVAESLRSDYTDRIWFVDLAPLARRISATVLATVGSREQARPTPSPECSFYRQRHPIGVST
jgi:hypothetical protein